LAQRHAEARHIEAASECVVEANFLAASTPMQFRSMAYFWIARAAVAAGHVSIVSLLAQATRESIDAMLADAQSPAKEDAEGIPVQGFLQQLWGSLTARRKATGSAELASLEKEWGRPHWLFWTALTLRELKDSAGIESLRQALRATPRRGSEIDLQVAAVAGDTPYLSRFASFYPENSTDPVWKRPGNMALALAEAGMRDVFDKLHEAGAFEVEQPAESLKLYAWSFSKQGRYDEALANASTISDDEERARALYRISETAEILGADTDSLRRIGESARSFYQDLIHRPSSDNKNWRLYSWLASALLHAGLKEDALILAEQVCRTDLTAAEDLSTLLPVMETESAKVHRERLQKSLAGDAIGALRSLKDVLLSWFSSRGTRSASQRVMSLLAQAKREKADASEAYQLWLKALAESRLGGRGLVDRVIADVRDVLGDGAHVPNADSMREEIAQLDIAFEAQAVEATRSAKR
jgi:hypothetical protein